MNIPALLRSLPPVALPLCALLILCASISPLCEFFKGAWGSTPAKVETGAASVRRQRGSPLLLSAIVLILSLAAAASVDELYSRRGWIPAAGGPRNLPPTLPPPDDPRYSEVRASLVASRRDLPESEAGAGSGGDGEGGTDGSRRGYALITGASSGIGRSIAVQLARRGVGVVLVARGGSDGRLDAVASDLSSCYGVSARVVRADLSAPGEARRVHGATAGAGLTIRYLIACAGLGPTAPHVELGEGGSSLVERAVRVNVESTAVLSSLYGADMARLAAAEREGSGRRGGDMPRIMVVSSIMGMGPGLPGAALYGATKAFGLSLGRALAIEMEPLGVGVTTVCPGATRTNFAVSGGLERAALWNFPLGTVMDADDVAEGAVEAMFRGRAEYVPGLPNKVMMAMVVPLLPVRAAMKFFQFCWSPWPFPFPRAWAKGDNSEEGSARTEALIAKDNVRNKERGQDGTCETSGEEKMHHSTVAGSGQHDFPETALVVEEVGDAKI